VIEQTRKKIKKDYALSSLRPEVGKKNIFLILSLVFFSFLLSGADHNKAIEEPLLPQVSISVDENKHYQLIVDGSQFIIKGVCYSPVPIGKHHGFDFWQQDLEVFKVDGELMKKLGVNTIRIYEPGRDPKRTKEIIDYFYKEFGIRTIMGHWMGFWQGPYPDYANSEFRRRIKEDCLKMVEEFKDEPGILVLLLGNENNCSFGKQKLRVWTSPALEKIKDPFKKRKKKARIYYRFVNDVARAVKKIDPNHKIALGNGGVDFLEVAKRYSRNFDLLGFSIYNGKSFSSLHSNTAAPRQLPSPEAPARLRAISFH